MHNLLFCSRCLNWNHSSLQLPLTLILSWFGFASCFTIQTERQKSEQWFDWIIITWPWVRVNSMWHQATQVFLPGKAAKKDSAEVRPSLIRWIRHVDPLWEAKPVAWNKAGITTSHSWMPNPEWQGHPSAVPKCPTAWLAAVSSHSWCGLYCVGMN